MKLTSLFSLLAAGLCLGGEMSVNYKDGNVECEGFVVTPENADNTPVILVVHQWMGLTEYEKSRCRQLAELGYIAFAVDIYGKGVRPSNKKESAQQSSKYKSDRALFRSRLNAGLDAALKTEGADSDRVAAVGYCFGGTGVLELARSGANVDGVVSFHGGLGSPTPDDASNIKGRVLVLHGAVDPMVSAKELADFEAEMTENQVDWELIKYGSAVHSFTQPMAGNDPSKGVAYNKKADQRSWQRMKNFLENLFGK
ncbi:dienelactone hydrolase family protein [Rubritalea spongiae]|uniref:Dienelactone hydrolase family protein n=1 Tax=Rubritalea spongiae TaxID=430797 RepID=A0ABW5E3E1_9BACT